MTTSWDRSASLGWVGGPAWPALVGRVGNSRSQLIVLMLLLVAGTVGVVLVLRLYLAVAVGHLDFSEARQQMVP